LKIKVVSRSKVIGWEEGLVILVSRPLHNSCGHPERSFGVRQLAAAFCPASLLAGFRMHAQFPASKLAGTIRHSRSASKLAGEKAAASCRTPKLRTGDWGTKACPPPVRASITRSICPATQESLPILKKDCFLTDRGGNVYENKGSAFHGRGGTGNVYENKGT